MSRVGGDNRWQANAGFVPGMGGDQWTGHPGDAQGQGHQPGHDFKPGAGPGGGVPPRSSWMTAPPGRGMPGGSVYAPEFVPGMGGAQPQGQGGEMYADGGDRGYVGGFEQDAPDDLAYGGMRNQLQMIPSHPHHAPPQQQRSAPHSQLSSKSDMFVPQASTGHQPQPPPFVPNNNTPHNFSQPPQRPHPHSHPPHPHPHQHQHPPPGVLRGGAPEFPQPQIRMMGQQGGQQQPGYMGMPNPGHPGGPGVQRVGHGNMGRLSADAHWLNHFRAENVMEELRIRAKAEHQRIPADDPMFKQLPMAVGSGSHAYHSLVPLDKPFPSSQPSVTYGAPSFVFKATCRSDNRSHMLTCVPPFQRPGSSSGVITHPGHPHNQYSGQMGHMGRSGMLQGNRGPMLPEVSKVVGADAVRHPAVVPFHRCFVGNFRDRPAFFAAYQFFANSQTLEEKYGLSQRFFKPKGQYLPEDVIWSYLAQLCGGLNAIHSANLAFKMMHVSKVLVTGQNRVRLNGLAMADALGLYDAASGQSLRQAQIDDVVNLGRVILQVACQSSMEYQTPANIAKGMETMSQRYSAHLRDYVGLLVAAANQGNHMAFMSAREAYASPVLAPHIARLAEASLCQSDMMEAQLSRELENARLFRLVMKLGFINERPSQEMDSRDSWSETGDRYLLKLFRDFVFHQEDDDGRPMLDTAHIVSCLNKLDAGSREKVLLVSRDESSVVVTSYSELRRCLQESLDELHTQQLEGQMDSSQGMPYPPDMHNGAMQMMGNMTLAGPQMEGFPGMEGQPW